MFYSFLVNAQTELVKAQVERVYNIPVFMYAYPDSDFTEIKDLDATMSAISEILGSEASVADKTKELVSKAKRRLSQGKIEEFNAIIINPDDFTGTIIKLSDKENLLATPNKVNNVPVYMFSYPKEPFEEIDIFTATWSVIFSENVASVVSEIVNKGKKKLKKGKIKPFDAVIISPDDYRGTFIKFK